MLNLINYLFPNYSYKIKYFYYFFIVFIVSYYLSMDIFYNLQVFGQSICSRLFIWFIYFILIFPCVVD